MTREAKRDNEILSTLKIKLVQEKISLIKVTSFVNFTAGGDNCHEKFQRR